MSHNYIWCIYKLVPDEIHPQLEDDLHKAENECITIRQQPVDKFKDNQLFLIPWGHQVYIIDKCKSAQEAIFYVEKTIKNGWSRAMLMNFIDAYLYKTQGKAINNFDRLLPDVQSYLAKETLKDPYNFDFLTLTKNYKEKVKEFVPQKNPLNYHLIIRG